MNFQISPKYIEVFPYDGLSLKFFASYIGRIYNYSGIAKLIRGANLENYITGRVFFDIISTAKFDNLLLP